MKTIEVDEELYRYIASHTRTIGESASNILRRMLNLPSYTGSEDLGAPLTIDQKKKITKEEKAEFNHWLASNELSEQKKAVDRFILILAKLYQLDPHGFAQTAEGLHGRTRVYFATDKQILIENGNHTKPKAITDTPYWVITNTNAARKKSMLAQMMTAMKLPEALIEKACNII